MIAVPQAFAKWRLMWRLVPRVLERWNRAGRRPGMHLALLETTSKVCASLRQPRHLCTVRVKAMQRGCWLNPSRISVIIAAHTI